LATRLSARHVVFDGYQFGDDLERALSVQHHSVVAIDDFGHARHQHANVIVNQNCYARERDYPERRPQTSLLLGPRYVLLRQEFWPWRDRTRRIRSSEVRHVLVLAGGSDPVGFSERAIKAVHNLPVLTRVVIGAANNRKVDLKRVADAIGVEVVI